MRILRVLTVAAAAIVLTAAMPAAADSWKGDNGHGRHFKQEHGNGHWRHRDGAVVVYGGPRYVYYPPPPAYYAPPPPVYYVPPPVYYAPPPPPVYYAPAPSISFGVTLPIN